jgi:hypothetical protein
MMMTMFLQQQIAASMVDVFLGAASEPWFFARCKRDIHHTCKAPTDLNAHTALACFLHQK